MGQWASEIRTGLLFAEWDSRQYTMYLNNVCGLPIFFELSRRLVARLGSFPFGISISL